MPARLLVALAILALLSGAVTTVLYSPHTPPLNTLNQLSLDNLDPRQIIAKLTPPELVAQLDHLTPPQVFTPPPLRSATGGPAGNLSANGILNATNQHRAAADLPPLKLNSQLSQAAERKVTDMFLQQYFEHDSPDGTSAADLVKAAGYDFLLVGENLALGNYASDAALVQAWMDSPGHRANILKPGYTEIGIAARPGAFEDSNTWLAVQEFGTPSTSCPEPDPTNQATFDTTTTELTELNQDLNTTQQELDSLANQIETLVEEINQLSQSGNDLIAAGNDKISEGNTAAQSQNTASAQALWDEGANLQAQGQAAHDQATAKQAEYDQLNQTYEDRRQSYNNNVATFNQRNTDQQDLATDLNQQINAYNDCVKQFK